MDILAALAAQVAAHFHTFDPEYAGRFVRDALEGLNESGALETDLDSIPDEHFATATAWISRQTETHMKWFVYRSPEGVEIWVHEFFSDDVIKQTERYAASVHCHRYGFASTLLKGGYTADYHKVMPLDGELKQGVPVEDRIIHHETYRAGDTYFMQHSEFHRLRDFEPGTVSCVVQLPPQAVSSFVVDQGTKTLIEYINYGDDRERMQRAYRTGVR